MVVWTAFLIVWPAWVTTWRWKSVVSLVVGTTSQGQGCPSWGWIWRKSEAKSPLGTEESKIKRLQRFLGNKDINPEKLYEFFAYKLLQKYKFKSKSIYIIFDHTTIDDRLVILQFSLKVGKRAVPLWFKLFKYKQDGNKDFIHVKESLKFLHH